VRLYPCLHGVIVRVLIAAAIGLEAHLPTGRRTEKKNRGFLFASLGDFLFFSFFSFFFPVTSMIDLLLEQGFLN